jgi:hypothetical protein
VDLNFNQLNFINFDPLHEHLKILLFDCHFSEEFKRHFSEEFKRYEINFCCDEVKLQP